MKFIYMQWMAVTASGASGANVARLVEEEHKRGHANATNLNRKQEERSVMNSDQKWKLNNVTRRLVEVGITHPGGVLYKFLAGCVGGVARIFQRSGHTVSNIIFMAFSPRNVVGCLLKKGLQRRGHGHPRTPPPPRYDLVCTAGTM